MATILPPTAESVEARLEGHISWQRAMKAAIRSGRALCEVLNVDPSVVCQDAERDFPVFVPQEYVRRMRSGDARDPLLRQVLAVQAETSTEGLIDPVGDLESQRLEGLLHKYPGRVLLVATGACAVHCRYCFRRHFPYDEVPKGEEQWRRWLDYICGDDSIHEVILSGGDPLTLADTRLRRFVESLNAIPHVRRLRIHTRTPVMIPQRVCAELLDWMRVCKASVYVVLHVNHAQEIDDSVERAIQRLRDAGASLLNQAVLLAGVNDSQVALCELFERLVDLQVQPYYLHQLDPVQGGMHFAVDDAEAKRLIQFVREQLPGYAVPTLVKELAGRSSKTPLTPNPSPRNARNGARVAKP